MVSSDPKGAVSASTRKSPSAPAEAPVQRRTVRKTKCVSDGVHTPETTAAHAAQDRSRRDPPGTTSSRGPQRIRCGPSPVPLPRQGPEAGTMSPVLSRPPIAPHSCPVNIGARVPGVGEGTAATGMPTGAQRATGPVRRGAPTRGQEARHRGTLPAKTKAHDQVPSNNGPGLPQTRTARTTRTQSGHGRQCQATSKPARGAHQGATPPPHTERSTARLRRSGAAARLPGLDHP